MIGYVTVGTNDFKRAIQFYDELLVTIGINRLWIHDSMAAWGPSRQQAALCVVTPYDDNVATAGNCVMIALKVSSQEQVRVLHAKAVELGGRNEGEPGPRGDHGFYGGYFRDLDGNKINAYIPCSHRPSIFSRTYSL